MMFFLIKIDSEALGGSMSGAKDSILARRGLEEGQRWELREKGISEWKELLLQSKFLEP